MVVQKGSDGHGPRRIDLNALGTNRGERDWSHDSAKLCESLSYEAEITR